MKLFTKEKLQAGLKEKYSLLAWKVRMDKVIKCKQ
jgi:hypothetical protein